MQALSREDRVLQELEKIAFGDGSVTGRLKAIELFGRNIGLFKSKNVPEKTRTADKIKNFIKLKLATLFD